MRSGQARPGQVRSGQVRSGQVGSGRVRSGKVRLDTAIYASRASGQKLKKTCNQDLIKLKVC